MEEPGVCKAALCKLCHGDFKAKFQRKTKETPLYARPTTATMRREIATLLSSPKKAVDRTSRSPSRLGFEDLPAEVRLQVYRACLESSPGVPIAGWVKGGGFHPDRSLPTHIRRLFIYATHTFDPVILKLNKRIHAEAQHEIYKHIAVTMCTMDLTAQLPQLKYWLSESPMRFIRTFELPVTIPTHKGAPLPSRLLPNACSVDHIRRLGQVFAKAPNLRNLSIVVMFHLYPPFVVSDVLYRISTQDRWLKRLAMITSSLPMTCKSTLIIKVSSRYGKYALDTLKVEKGLVALTSSSKIFDEVQQYSTTLVVDMAGGPRRGMPLQAIAFG